MTTPRDAFTAAGRTAPQQAVFAHLQRLLRLRASRRDLRHGATQNLHVAEQSWVYRRGATVVALNNDSKPVEIRLAGLRLPADALGLCAAPRRDAAGVTVIVVPARTGCVF